MTSAMDRVLEALRQYDPNTKAHGNGYRALCPAHNDHDPSLDVDPGIDRVLVTCRSRRCDIAEIAKGLGLRVADFFETQPDWANPRRGYSYPDGRMVDRIPRPGGKKSFPQRGNLTGTSLFRISFPDNATAFVCEGEKDVEAAESIGLAATTSAQGAGSAHKFDWSPLAGREVVIVAHRDTGGRKYARTVRDLLTPIATSVRVVQAAEGNDLADHILMGHSAEELQPFELLDEDEAQDPLDLVTKDHAALTHIVAYARARRIGPWAAIGEGLKLAIAATEPHVKLPAIVGKPASLNLFIANTAVSGGGKGIASGALAGLTILDPKGFPIATKVLPIGSGEGISRTFEKKTITLDDGTEEERQLITRAIFDCAEIDTLAALKGRQGATVMPELRKVYSGEQLGFANSGAATRNTVDAHSYRACLTVGVQPKKAHILLNDVDGGTPQRFVWLPTLDPDAPEVAPEAPKPHTVRLPMYGNEMTVAQEIRSEIDTFHWTKLTGGDVDPLDGHKYLTRLKVAAAITILDGRTAIGINEWNRADIIMKVSDRTRADCIGTAKKSAKAANLARAYDAADREAIIETDRDNRAVTRVEKLIVRHLTSEATREMPRGEVRKKLPSRDREHFDTAVLNLINDGTITKRTEGATEYITLQQT